MTHHRTRSEAERVTLAIDKEGLLTGEEGEDVLVHVACAEQNPDTIIPYGKGYTYEDGDTCAICGNDLAYD